MRYIHTLVLYVLIHLLSIPTAIGKLPLLIKATSGACTASSTNSEELFSEDYTFLNHQAKKNGLNAVLLIAGKTELHPASLERIMVNTALCPAYYSSLFNFLFPKHVFW
jgi:hypothetical protein